MTWLPLSLWGLFKSQKYFGHSWLPLFFVVVMLVPQASVVVSGLIVNPQKIGLILVLGLALYKSAVGRAEIPRYALLFTGLLLGSVMFNLETSLWSGISCIQFVSSVVGVAVLISSLGGEKLFEMVDALTVPIVALGLVEYFMQAPLFSNGANEQLLELGYKGLGGRTRNDLHRIQLLFHAPFLAAELFLFQLTTVFFSSRRGVVKGVLCLVLIFLIYQTQSRGALFVLTLLGTVLLVRSRLLRTISRTRFLLVLSTIAIIVGVFSFAGEFYTYAENNRFSDEKASSLFERADQFLRVASLFQENPLIGLGPMRNLEDLEQINRMDNFYLRFLIEFGILGIIWLVAVGWKAFKEARFNPRRLGLIVVFFACRFIYQDPVFLIFLAPLVIWEKRNVDYSGQ